MQSLQMHQKTLVRALNYVDKATNTVQCKCPRRAELADTPAMPELDKAIEQLMENHKDDNDEELTKVMLKMITDEFAASALNTF